MDGQNRYMSQKQNLKSNRIIWKIQKMKLETKDLLTVDEISSKEFLELIDFSIKLKEEYKTGSGKTDPFLENKT